MEPLPSKPRTFVYVDGFNLYHRLIKGTPYKWLNLATLCDLLLPECDILKIKYFSARISSTPHDPEQQLRQEIYLRALATEPRIETIFGQFQSGPKKFPVYPWKYTDDGNAVMTKIFFANEKGSDVNLASNLMFDAMTKSAEAYVVITNDSDQVMPLSLLHNNFKAVLGLLVPNEAPSKKLMQLNLPIMKRIRKGVLAASQFPETLSDKSGFIRKPSGW